MLQAGCDPARDDAPLRAAIRRWYRTGEWTVEADVWLDRLARHAARLTIHDGSTSREDLEAVARMAAFSALRSHHVDPDGRPYAYLLTCAVHACCKASQRSHRHWQQMLPATALDEESAGIDEEPPVDDFAPGLAGDLDWQKTKGVFLGLLRERYLPVAELWLAGCEHREIAARLRMPASTVRVQVHRIIMRLRSALDREASP